MNKEFIKYIDLKELIKNGVICLVIMLLIPELWSLKCQKLLFFVFFANDSKKLITV